MYKRIFLLTCFITSFSVYSAENDFDKMCGYFKELDNTLVINKLNQTQREAFINQRVIKNLKVNSPARQTWEVVIYAVPEERYDMVQSTAVELLKTSWRCDAMMKYISTVGK